MFKWIFIILIVYVVLTVIITSKKRTTSDGETICVFTAANNFGSISKGTVVNAVLKSDRIYIYKKINSEYNVSLDYRKITNVKLTSDTEIIQKSKSVGGRAVLGGLVLGPTGAILGGMSALNNTQQKAHNYIVINYTSSNEEIEAILLEISLMDAWDKFMKELQERTGTTEEKSVNL